MAELNIEGMELGDGVLETIVSIAIKDLDGVASIGSSSGNGLLSRFTSRGSNGVEAETLEDGSLALDVHIEVYANQVLPEVAQQVRDAVASAVSTQLAMPVSQVDVYIDSLRFE